jgi:hypothetical protein
LWLSGILKIFRRKVKQGENAVQEDAYALRLARRQVTELYPQIAEEKLEGYLKNKPGLT